VGVFSLQGYGEIMVFDIIYRGRALRIAIGLTVLVLVMAGGASAATEINSCTTISSPGEYVLTTNIMDFGGAYCISIASNDVIFDGAGYTIDGRDIYGTRGVQDPADFAYRRNVTVKNLNVTDWDYGVYFLQTDGSIINSTASSNLYGIFLYGSSNITLINNTANSNFYDGIILSGSSNNTIINNAASSNSNGIHLIFSSRYNILTDNIVSSNSNGINLQDTTYNTLTNNAIRSNSRGIYLYSFSEPSSNNTIHNNYFNNTNNFGFDGIIYSNYWNITKTADKNFIGGPYLGGNFWAQPDGNGYSQKCIDSEPDGICDLPYELDSNNIDYLPLASYTATTPSTDSIPPVINSVELNTTVPNTSDAILITVNATDNIGVTGVMANSVALTVQGGNTLTWSGTITALEGTHSVNVSATDAENNVAWNNSTSYTATTPTVTNSISGFKINDINGNGKWDAGEKGISNWTIRLIGIIGKGKNATVIRNETLTDATGFYKFDNLSAGRYFVIEKLKKGFVPTSSPVKRIKLAQGKNSMNNNFTNRPIHSWDKKDDNRDIDDYEAINRDIDKYKEDTNGD
jgi:parallel beta-helix repeat protein